MASKVLKVLIADDERIVRENMHQYIPWDSMGMEVIDVVENGALALDILKTARVDIMIMDIRMPVMDGLELLENIRALGLNVLVIVLSAYDQFEYAQKAIQSRRVFEYVLKPVKRRDFCQLLQRAAAALEEQRDAPVAERESASLEIVQAHFARHIRRRDLEGALKVLEEYAGKVNPEDPEAIFDLKRLMLNLHTEIRLFLSQEGISIGSHRMDFDLLNEFNQCTRPEELTHRFAQLVEETRPFLEQHPTGDAPTKAGAVVRHCVEQIQRHYTEPDFSLYQLAEEMKLSTNYLSSLFKKEMGVGYVRYINTLRIEKAKQLLRDMRFRTNEVATLVGIENPRYFTRIFKEMTGLAPAEYRSRIKVHSEDN